MICQYCGKNPAVMQVKMIADGNLTEYAVCAESARQLGCGNLFTGLGYQFSDIVGEFFKSESETVRCECCGMTFSDIVHSGRVGCAECYRTFYDRLLPVIRQIHGSGVHRGKTPKGDLPQLRVSGKLAVRKNRNEPDGGPE